jgi:hypothetical protein
MPKLVLAALIAATAVQAQPAAAATIRASTDSAEERKALQILTACLAEARPRWARGTLSHPYLSDAQASAAAMALSGTDTCVRSRDGAELTLRTSGMVGSLAEHFLRSELAMADSARVAAKLASLAPLNVSEDFALCVASRNPGAARDLILSEPGSAEEMRSAQQLGLHVEPCTQPGEEMVVELQSLRALVATALYRGVTAVLATR